MKLAQFRREDSDRQRLGILVGDVICDIADLAGAAKNAGEDPPEWLLEASNTLDVIKRGPSASDEINSLLAHVPPRSAIGPT